VDCEKKIEKVGNIRDRGILMPEGPEVREYVDYIKPLLKDNELEDFILMSGKYLTQLLNESEEETDFISKVKMLKAQLPSRILDVKSKGKKIFITLENGYIITFTHGMTGKWSDKESNHSRIKLEMKNGQRGDSGVYFDDVRSFGRVNIQTQQEAKREWRRLGPDPLTEDLDVDDFIKRLGKKARSKVGGVLLDQSIISGIGNYLRCDILWYSKLDAETRLGDMTEREKRRLFKNCVNMCRYYAGMETSLEITPEDFGRQTFVYMQDTDPYGNVVHRKSFLGRTLHYIERDSWLMKLGRNQLL
jgi:formamidopyrimidine-DNA glycosylase